MKPSAIKELWVQIKSYSAGPWDQKNKLILFFFLGLFLVGYTYIQSHSGSDSKKRFQIDTIIPPGYVLIPIKLLNAQAISSAIGSYGVADIYTTVEGQKSKRLFSKAKIIQAEDSEDPVFSVLVKETRAHLLSSYANPFFAAVQNPKAKTDESDYAGPPKVQIIYQN